MKSCRFLLVPVVLAALAIPANAGILFGKKSQPKQNPADRVMELVGTVKTDPDERKRSSAAEELRQFDPAQYPDMVPVLIDVLRTDQKSSVRSEAAQTLSKLRPISQQAGWALEQAMHHDDSMRVRLQARSSLLLYHWAGYHSKPNNAPAIQSKEPPLAGGIEQVAPLPPAPATQTRLIPSSNQSNTPPLFPGDPQLQGMPVRNIQGPELVPNQ